MSISYHDSGVLRALSYSEIQWREEDERGPASAGHEGCRNDAASKYELFANWPLVTLCYQRMVTV